MNLLVDDLDAPLRTDDGNKGNRRLGQDFKSSRPPLPDGCTDTRLASRDTLLTSYPLASPSAHDGDLPKYLRAGLYAAHPGEARLLNHAQPCAI